MTQDPRNQGAAPPRPVDAERVEPDHELKSHPDVFWPAARGEKMFEFRKDDRPGGFHVGQMVRLRCYDRGGYVEVDPLDRRITNILRGGEFGLQEGYCILSLAPTSPAHSPDKAVTREGLPILPDGWTYVRNDQGEIRVQPPAGTVFEPHALATKPTGTEAGRGVVPTGWKLVPVEATEEMEAAGWIDKEDVSPSEIYWAMLAAAPTPPVSPSPDSTGPAGAEEIGDAPWLAYRKWQDETKPGYWCESGFRAGYAAGRAALTPSAPIAGPSPDSTGQGDAQTQEGGR